MTSYNLALLSDDDRAAIEMHKGALFADFKGDRLTIEQEAVVIVNRLKRGVIDRNKVKKIIENSPQSEKLRNYINQHRRKDE